MSFRPGDEGKSFASDITVRQVGKAKRIRFLPAVGMTKVVILVPLSLFPIKFILLPQ